MAIRRFRKPYRMQRKKSILKSRFFWLGILISIIAGGIFYFLFFSATFQVENIIIAGEKKVSKKDIKSLIVKKLESRILFFKTKSIFLVNLDEIKNDILNNYPKIIEVEMNKRLPDVLNIAITERLGLAVWCKKDICFLLDKKGVIFDPVRNTVSNGDGAGEASSETDLPKITDKQNIDSFNLGAQVIKEDILTSIFDIRKQLRESLKTDIEEFVILNSERLNIKTTEGWEIYFNSKEDINWQLTKLNLVLKEEIPQEKKGDLEYIDLRFTRVYYKYK